MVTDCDTIIVGASLAGLSLRGAYFRGKSFQKSPFRLGAFPERARAEAWCIHIAS